MIIKFKINRLKLNLICCCFIFHGLENKHNKKIVIDYRVKKKEEKKIKHRSIIFHFARTINIRNNLEMKEQWKKKI